MPKYLFPCECGKQITIAVGQAGQTVHCACGKAVEAPGMREIRSLSAVEAPAQTTTWSHTQGIAFITGIVLLVGGVGGVSYYGYVYSQLQLSYGTHGEVEIDSMELVALHNEWLRLRDEGLIPTMIPRHLHERRRAVLLKWTLAGMGISTVVGLASVIGSLCFRTSDTKPNQ